MSAPPLSVPLRFVARETPVRRGEPVTVGLPWPRGAVTDERHFRLIGPDGSEQVLQTRVLDRWPDGSVRWCLFDFLATLDGVDDGYRVEAGDGLRELIAGPTSGVGQEHVARLSRGLAFEFIDGGDSVRYCRADDVEVGPIRTRTAFRSDPIRGLELFGWVDHFPSARTVRV